MQILNDFFALKILLICLNKSTLCQSILKSKDLCQKKILMAIFSTKNNKIMLSQEQIWNKIKMLILYSSMKKNYSLGIFQLRKSIDFIAKVLEIIFSNLRVKYEHK